VFLEKNERMHGDRYIEILQSKLPLVMELHGCVTFMQDGTPCHTAKNTMTWFRSSHISVLEWPGNSPDINPIENMWEIMKHKVSAKNPSSLDELKRAIKEVWCWKLAISCVTSCASQCQVALQRLYLPKADQRNIDNFTVNNVMSLL
jgi:transposase